MSKSLDAAQIESYHRDGYLLLRAIFSPDEASAWDVESRRLLRLGLGHQDNWRTVLYRNAAGFAVIDRLNPVIDISPVFKLLVQDQRILQTLSDLYGEAMLLFKDKLIYKMPGVPGYGMHQDYSLWQKFPKDLVNVIVSIDGADADNGGVEFFPGQHERLLSAAGESRYMTDEEAREIDLSTGESVKSEPGDIIIFDCLTPHRSGVNQANRLRRQLYLTYSSARNGDMYQQQLDYINEVERRKRGDAAERMFFR